MLIRVSLAALLLVVPATVEASMVSMLKHGQLHFCGKQACFAPNICLPFLGVSVCVRTNTPKCANIKCPPKHECALLQDVCDSLPCHPKAYCVRSNPCGICQAPDHFCELIPKPVCRHMIEPTCLNKKCGYGEICLKEPLECNFPPCRVKFHCVPAWPWHYAEDKSRGAVDGESAGTGGDGDAGDSGGSGDSGDSGDSWRRFSSREPFTGGFYGANIPFIHNNVIGSSVGGAAEGSVYRSSRRPVSERKEQHVEEDNGSDSDTDEEEEEEEEEEDQAF